MKWIVVCLFAVSYIQAQEPSESDSLRNPFRTIEEMTFPEPPSDKKNLFFWFHEHLEDAAKQSGVRINSINVRKERVLEEATDLIGLHYYCGWDADFPSLMRFLEILDDWPVRVTVENLTISARRMPRRDASGKPNTARSPLNGNMILGLYWDGAPVPADSDSVSSSVFPGDIPMFLDDLAFLTEDSHLTHVQIKQGNLITLQGESKDPVAFYERLSRLDYLSDITPGNAITTARNRGDVRRFMYRAVMEAGSIRN